MTLVFAHRGLHTNERENTLASFRAARSVGADGVELDVRRSADGLLVVHHDPKVAGRAVADTAAAELPDYVPSLFGALEACAGIHVNVEIKAPPSSGGLDHDARGALARQVVDLLHSSGRAGDVVVSSFDLAICEAVRQADSAIAVGWLIKPGRALLPRLETARDAGLQAAHPHYRWVDAAVRSAARALGLALNVWTVNRPDDLAAMVALEVDSMITDDPATALEVLGRPVGGPQRLT